MTKLKRKLRDLTEEELQAIRKKSMGEFMAYIKKNKVINDTTIMLAQKQFENIWLNNQRDEFAKVNRISRRTVDNIVWENSIKEIRTSLFFQIVNLIPFPNLFGSRESAIR